MKLPAPGTMFQDRRRIAQLAGDVGFACCLGLPFALLHARAVADILLVTADLGFLAACWAEQSWAWLRRPYPIAALGWWAWLVLCSALGTGGLGFAIVAIRLPLLALATGWALRDAGRRRIAWWVLAAAFWWVVLECWHQHFLGTNLFGHGRYIDGALTGPFAKPRAGPALILIFFPVVLPAAWLLLGRPSRASKAAGVGVAVLAVVTQVLIGQRMPTALLVLGLAVTGLLLPRLRLALLFAGVLAGLLLLAAPVLSPNTYDKLVVETETQLRHFPQSAYGLIFVRAAVIANRYPLTGLGFDGFRRGCSDFWNMHGLDGIGIPTDHLNGGMDACNIHPHNYYLEQADNAGLPELALFIVMAGSLLWQLGRPLLGRRRALADPLLAGCFVAAVLAFWPVASTSAFTSLPNAGWVFLVAGFGLAAARADRVTPDRAGPRQASPAPAPATFPQSPAS